MRKFLLIVIILSLLPLLAVGKSTMSSPKTFVNIGTDYAAGVVYYSLCQDSTGMVWVGTNMGLFDYDGYKMHHRVANVDNANTNINCLIIRNDTIYAGADTGVLMYDIKAGKYLPHGIAFPSDVRSLAFDGNCLWIGSLKGLYKYDLITSDLRNMSQGLSHNAVYSVAVTQHGDLYIGTYNGLCRYDRMTGHVEKVDIDEPWRKGNLFVNVIADDPGRNCLWIGTEGALYCYKYSSGEVERVPQLGRQSIKSLDISSTGDLVVGTDNGLFIYSNNGKIEYYRHDSRMSTSLSNNVVWSVMVDRDGNLWAGTESGLSMSVNGGDFVAMPLYSLTGSSDGCRFYTIFRDSRGYLWLGGTNGLIRRSRNGDVKWYMMENDKYPLKHNRIRSICEDSRYELWIATDGGINRYDYVKEQFVNYIVTDSTHTYNANWAYGVIDDRQGNMWVGSYLGGLLAVNRGRLVASDGECVADLSFNATNGLPNNMINQLVLARDGDLWASLYKSGELVKIDYRANVLPSVKVIDICESYIQYIIADRHSDGGLWCGYHNGFARVSSADTVTARYTFPVAFDIDVYAMALLRKDLWITTSHGVWVMNTDSCTMQRLRLPDRLYTSIYYDRASKKMLLGGDEELLFVDPSITAYRNDEYEIDITALYVNDVPYSYANGETDDDVVRLSHNQNRLRIEFSDFDYRLDNRKGFDYRIKGLSDQWVSLPSGNNTISISDIAPGSYVLEIRQSDGNGIHAVEELRIDISPAWYASWWAITIYVLLGILFVLWVFNFLRLKIRLRMERVRSEKTLEMVNNKMEFLTNISHELKTPLSMIIGPLSKMLNEEKNPDTRRHLDAIHQNALKLNALIHRALEVNRMDANPDNLLIYSQIEMVAFCRSIFDTYREGYPMKQMVFDCSESRIMMNADVVKMESVVNNLLSNACKYSDDDAKVELSLSLRDGNVVIAVSDNGVGIPADELPLIFQRLYQSSATKGSKDGTGIGLYLAKTYVEMHGGTLQVQSSLGEGSVFTVTMPVGDVSDVQVDGRSEMVQQDGRPRILIVEDNAAIASFIRDILKDKYNCSIVDNGKAGLAACNATPPDLIIADMMMPVMSGVEMCRRIKSCNRIAAVPIIMLTAKDDRFTEAECIKAGIDVFMAKPFDASMLHDRVDQLLKYREIVRSNLRVEDITTVKQDEVESADEKMLAEVSKVIEDNIADPDMNVSYVCDKVGMSSKQLYRMLKNFTGSSPSDYIRQVRMKKAAMLLQQHKFTVSEVMYMVGFSSSSYFSKCFALQFGCTPRQYAEKQCSQA